MTNPTSNPKLLELLQRAHVAQSGGPQSEHTLKAREYLAKAIQLVASPDETTSAQGRYDAIFAVIYGKRPEAMTIEERHSDGWLDANRKTLDILRLTVQPEEPPGYSQAYADQMRTALLLLVPSNDPETHKIAFNALLPPQSKSPPCHPDPTGKTREPPHCPSCSCGLEAAVGVPS
jgi:hypothetical protein